MASTPSALLGSAATVRMRAARARLRMHQVVATVFLPAAVLFILLGARVLPWTYYIIVLVLGFFESVSSLVNGVVLYGGVHSVWRRFTKHAVARGWLLTSSTASSRERRAGGVAPDAVDGPSPNGSLVVKAAAGWASSPGSVVGGSYLGKSVGDAVAGAQQQ